MIRSVLWEGQPSSRERDGSCPGRWEKVPEAGGRLQQRRGHLEMAASPGGEKAGKVRNQSRASDRSCLSS